MNLTSDAESLANRGLDLMQDCQIDRYGSLIDKGLSRVSVPYIRAVPLLTLNSNSEGFPYIRQVPRIAVSRSNHDSKSFWFNIFPMKAARLLTYLRQYL